MKRCIVLVCLSTVLCILFCKLKTKNKTGADMEKVDPMEKTNRQDTVAFTTPEFSLLPVFSYPF